MVDVSHPWDRRQVVDTLHVDAGSVATSGNGERPAHLLDPRTGGPAPDIGSLTVWAPSAARADCLSTGLFVLGPEAALGWAAVHEGFEVVVVEQGSSGAQVRRSAAFGSGGPS